MTQLVVDASMLLSAAVGRPDAPPALLLEAARAGNVELAICDRLLDEVRAGLNQPYVRARVTGSEAAALVGMLGALATSLPDPASPVRVLQDPGDDYLIALAVAADASAIVTGDRDILDHPDLVPPAITARTACERLGLVAGGR